MVDGGMIQSILSLVQDDIGPTHSLEEVCSALTDERDCPPHIDDLHATPSSTPPSTLPETPRDAPKFFFLCESCMSVLNSERQLQLHLNGKKHLTRIADLTEHFGKQGKVYAPTHPRLVPETLRKADVAVPHEIKEAISIVKAKSFGAKNSQGRPKKSTQADHASMQNLSALHAAQLASLRQLNQLANLQMMHRAQNALLLGMFNQGTDANQVLQTTWPQQPLEPLLCQW